MLHAHQSTLCHVEIFVIPHQSAAVTTTDFLVGGTCSEQLYGVCEAMYKPNLEPEDLFETISQCLLAAVDRDCLAGWGAIVHIITKDQVVSRHLKSRKD